ncbi:MAG: hypothetical protein NTZ95_03940 [Candidatus Omnitrophica bacterium]|nr:hypothetical protein [Candidatus Omnitrophota bacterium]
MKKLVVLIIIALFMLQGHANAAESVQKSNLTAGMAKSKIIKGQTTQTQILEIFGSPNIITKNKSGNEVWTYDKVSVDKSATEGYGNILVAGIAKENYSSSARTFTMMIEFDDNEVVKDYSYRSAAF